MRNVLKEDEVTELKRSTSELKEGIVSIVAILNKHHKGRLYFGIRDDGTVLGQELTSKTLRDVADAITTKIEPKIYPKVTNVKINDKDCILVEFEGDDLPYLADGRAYIRVSDQDKKLSVLEMRKILFKSENNKEKWEEKLSDVTIADVNENVLKEYIERANEAQRIPFKYTNKKDVLSKLGVIKNNRLLNAGKVLFCDDNGVELQVAIFATDKKVTFIDIDKKTGNLFQLMKEAQDYIRKNMIWTVEITDKREEYPEIPLDSIREAIVNSYVHRSYLDPKGTEISIFKDRIEIYNPGTFPLEYSPEDYIQNKAHSVLRNPLLANILYRSKDIESYSSGIQRIYNECKERNVKVNFRKEKYGFTVIFYRKEIKNDENLLYTNVRIKVDKNVGLNISKNMAQNEITKDEKGKKILYTNVRIKVDKNVGLNVVQKKILTFIMEDAFVKLEELAEKLHVSVRSVERNIDYLKNHNWIKRVGSKKSGYWKVIDKK